MIFISGRGSEENLEGDEDGDCVKESHEVEEVNEDPHPQEIRHEFENTVPIKHSRHK